MHVNLIKNIRKAVEVIIFSRHFKMFIKSFTIIMYKLYKLLLYMYKLAYITNLWTIDWFSTIQVNKIEYNKIYFHVYMSLYILELSILM